MKKKLIMRKNGKTQTQLAFALALLKAKPERKLLCQHTTDSQKL